MTSKLIEALKTVALRRDDTTSNALDSLSVNAHISPLGSADIPEPWKVAGVGLKMSFSESNLESRRNAEVIDESDSGSRTPPFVRSSVTQDLSYARHPRRVTTGLVSAERKLNRKVVFRAPYGKAISGMRSSTVNQTIKSAGLLAQIRKVPSIRNVAPITRILA